MDKDEVVTIHPRMLPLQLPLHPIAQAALSCFAVSGYHGTSIRKIAQTAGLSVPGIYHHFGSKHEILVEICNVAMHELIDASQRAVDHAGPDPLDRYDALVECLVQFHADFAAVAFVSFTEIRALNGDARDHHIAQRRREQDLVRRVVDEGIAAGVFTTRDPGDVARAVVSICLGISRWYRQDGPLSLDQVCAIHVRIARATAGCIQAPEELPTDRRCVSV
ncbi:MULTISPECIES: TetR/AcrR family transcriptional regulator [Auritidibacter]|uniref:TetR/AcrR family transcriptional regulator n=1 Tax=Auritidibacter ignavus TaxID=678932 RepID=A0AAJ6DBM1_9MICC|nr:MULTISPECIES: TetR/AcrR family transcriptional regulator [Auritidibacter]AXR74230.1 TetR/AcrR family transcriptional regulator [Auritidibacter sp. NML130574]NIH72058.1 AcrR family transcriptional regulator [Auritidibacter ignavus]PXA76714.1 TetR family transcriptional regulator [Auritidibacter sp. NML100628]RMX23930.1 TetR/AcrR family transcriptional regulator [Auritidibacter ignavus]WGH80715.1 TetR/AcrR family transcriptional regulator [Auritidibacter ignavus]